MTLYEVLLFLHVMFVILWVGAGILFHILGFRAMRANDDASMRQILADLDSLANTFFIPSSLLVVVFGIWLTIEGPWSFGDLWIVLGLVGFVLTFLTGILWIVPQTKRIQAVMERDGGMSPEALSVAQRMLVFARIDYVVLVLIVFDMAVKPTGDDVGTLILMALVFLLGAGLLLARSRSVAVPQRA
jgi:uncharacterized membrane protein